MKETEVVLTDDIDGSLASETFTYIWEGTIYQIDLSQTNGEEFRNTMEYYIQYSRKIGRDLRTKKRKSKDPKVAEIRSWAVRKGISLSPRGRLPRSVIDRYERETGGKKS